MKIKYFDKLWENWLENLSFHVGYDEYFDFDCCWKDDDAVKIDVREHRRYSFLHEFNIDWWLLDETYEEWDYYYEDWIAEKEKRERINSEYYVFWLDFFEHSMISFSLSMSRTDIWYYERDRSRDIWIIAVKNDWIDFIQAIKIARETINNYNSMLNGRIYERRLEDEDWFYDGCTWYYDDSDAVHDWENAIADYLNKKWIKFDSFELVNE